MTTVGSAVAGNYFGTADQAGNVFEWNDAVDGSARGLRGGSWNLGSNVLAASFGDYSFLTMPTLEENNVGFRVASVPVPEPSSFFSAMLICIGVMMRRRR